MDVDILHGITRAINAEWPDYEIHTNKLKQDVVEPCFFVQPIYNNQKHYPCGRINYDTNFLIQILCEQMSTSDKIKMGNRLHEILDVIDLGNGEKLRGRNKNFNVYEYCVNFSVDYIGFITEPNETEMFIDDLKINTIIGG